MSAATSKCANCGSVFKPDGTMLHSHCFNCVEEAVIEELNNLEIPER